VTSTRRLTANGLAMVLILAVLPMAFPSDAQVTTVALALAEGSEEAQLDALLDRGIAYYRAGAYRDAIAPLNAVLVARPDVAEAQLYTALSYLALGDDEMARRHFVALEALAATPRLREQVSTVLEVMRAGPVSPPLRRFIAAALEETLPARPRPHRPAFADSVLRRNFPYVP